MTKPFKYYKKEYKGTIIYTCDTDFSIYDYRPELIIYKRGWFTGHEDEIVLMIADVMKPIQERYKYFYFKNMKEATDYIQLLLK